MATLVPLEVGKVQHWPSDNPYEMRERQEHTCVEALTGLSYGVKNLTLLVIGSGH